MTYDQSCTRTTVDVCLRVYFETVSTHQIKISGIFSAVCLLLRMNEETHCVYSCIYNPISIGLHRYVCASQLRVIAIKKCYILLNKSLSLLFIMLISKCISKTRHECYTRWSIQFLIKLRDCLFIFFYSEHLHFLAQTHAFLVS